MTDSLLTAELDLSSRQLPQLITVEGPIGVGKTTLAKKLAGTFNYEMLLEQPEQNPFLEKFYRNPKQHALATQLCFLLQRAQQLQDLKQQDIFEPVRVSDFLIEKDRLFAEINLDKNELEIYQQVYDRLTLNAPVPDLVIYLQAPIDVLMRRIEQRGINSEQSISWSYLEKLNSAYSEFFHFYDDAPLLIVNAADIDFANNDADYFALVEYALNITSGRHYYNPTMFHTA